MIRHSRTEVANQTAHNIHELATSKTDSKLRSFIGLWNFFHRFVPNFARIASPLSKCHKKAQTQVLGTLEEEELNALRSLKEKIITSPVLALHKKQGHYTLDTDFYNGQARCVLMQKKDDDKDQPITYWSRTLSDNEKNPHTTHRDCFAVTWATLFFRPYLEGVQFPLRTDHYTLCRILNLADATGRLT